MEEKRKKLTTLSPSDAVVVMELYKSGVSRAKIARKYGVSFATIEGIVHGYTITHNMDVDKIAEGTEDEIKDFIRQRNEGKSWRDIAKAVGRSGVWVQGKVEEYERNKELEDSKKTITSLKDEIESMKQYVEQLKTKVVMEEPMLKVDKRDMAVVEQFDLEWIGYIMLGSMEVALFGSSSFYDAATPEVKAAMYQILSKNNRVPKKKDKLTKAI